ncbi:hypothetical protein [Spirosoma daeguense]
MPPEFDITIQEGQNWLAKYEYKREGTYVIEEQLDWNLVEDLGNFLELPTKGAYQGPTISALFNADELVKLDIARTKWRFVIAKYNNNFFLHIRSYVPFKGGSIPHTTYENLEADLKQDKLAYLSLSFDGNGRFISGVECNNKRWGNGIIDASTKKLPSTELDEIKREIYEDSLKAR